VDQIGEQSDAARSGEDDRLDAGGEREHEQRQGDGAKAGARALD